MPVGKAPQILRRRLLQAGASCLIAACHPGSARLRSAIPEDDGYARLAPTLRHMLGDPDAARMIGALYLQRHPEEATLERLRDHLFGPGRSAPPGSATLWMAERRSLDLAHEDVTVIAGWVLARSEARLCGLASMLAAT